MYVYIYVCMYIERYIMYNVFFFVHLVIYVYVCVCMYIYAYI